MISMSPVFRQLIRVIHCFMVLSFKNNNGNPTLKVENYIEELWVKFRENLFPSSRLFHTAICKVIKNCLSIFKIKSNNWWEILFEIRTVPLLSSVTLNTPYPVAKIFVWYFLHNLITHFFTTLVMVSEFHSLPMICHVLWHNSLKIFMESYFSNTFIHKVRYKDRYKAINQ